MSKLKKTGIRKFLIFPILIFIIALFTGCGPASSGGEKEAVSLTLWCDDRNMEILRSSLETFREMYKDEAEFDFSYGTESEISCKETVLADPQAAADIYVFADDQFYELWSAGALLEITRNTDEVIEAVGGVDSGAAHAAMKDGKLYAYPETEGNGYFLYYRPSYFSEEDIQSLDNILKTAAANNKKFAMDFSSGWYIYSFFKAAGLDISYDTNTNLASCNWNSTDGKYTGVDVVNAMLKVAAHPGFVSATDGAFLEGVKDGSIIAGVNGPWNADSVKEAWGDDFAAAKLPCCNIKSDQLQMCSFTGYKLVGINAYTKYPEWSMRLAEYLTGEDIQLRRFKEIGECPANVNVAHSEEVQASPVVAALAEQSRYGYTQNVPASFWDASELLGAMIAGLNSDNRDIQEVLDSMVKVVEATSSDE